MTTYDQIYTEFITRCKTSDVNLPKTTEKIHDVIVSAIKHYNNRLGDNIGYDNEDEVVNRKLTDNELIIIAHYIRLAFFENQLIDFSTTWNPFSKDIGIKNVQSQTSTLRELIKAENEEIEKLILYSSVDFI